MDGIFGVVVGAVGTIASLPALRQVGGGVRGWLTNKRRAARNKDAEPDYYFSAYEYACRFVAWEQWVNGRRAEVVSLKQGLETIKVKVSPRNGRDYVASLAPGRATLEDGAPSVGESGVRIFVIRFNPSLKKNER